MKIRLTDTWVLVTLSIVLHAFVFMGIFSLITVFQVQYPAHIEAMQKQREERRRQMEQQLWLDATAEETIRHPDGTVERRVRVAIPTNILSETNLPTTATPPGKKPKK
ncbi:MAG: hypothetical protein SFY92_10465 [Verrucomicrobiae bacterium]|nr:hypothetical protein [Verrucomicrobiae bacterium]